MTISNELMLAILSMDAYNEGYGAGLQMTPIVVSCHRASSADSRLVFGERNADLDPSFRARRP